MDLKKSIIKTLALVLVLALLGGCAAVSNEAPDEAQAGPKAPATDTEENVVRVSSLDELIAAVGPGVVVELAEGEYTLTPAEGGGDVTDFCRWTEVYDGWELEIHDAPDLTIRGAGADKTQIGAQPRFANVLVFRNCSRLTVADLTAGHTEAPGACSGGVLHLVECRNAVVADCALFGCGTVGVQAEGCSFLDVVRARIYECSWNAVAVSSSSGVHVTDCDIYACGTKEDWPAAGLFEANDADIFCVSGCRVYDNAAQSLLTAYGSQNVKFLSNDVHGNRFDAAVFDLSRSIAAVDGCALLDNSFLRWTETLRPVDAAGEALTDEALEAMTLRELDPADVTVTAPVTAAAEVEPGGEIRVTTVDELLAAIGPERTVILAPGVYDLSKATGYGGYGGAYYAWEETYDGPQLVIEGVQRLFIRAESEDPHDTVLTAAPRYANVLALRGCSGVSLTGVTAGHSEGMGECSGGVIDLSECSAVLLDSCRLYGCGTMGVSAWSCSSLVVRACEIFECSWCAASISETVGVYFWDCDFHDVPSPALYVGSCVDRLWNGRGFDDGIYDVAADGSLKAVYWSDGYAEPEQTGTPFREDSAELRFALQIQAVLALGDWEALAELTSYPLRIYTAGGTFVFPDRESLRAEQLSELLPGEFRRRVATAPLTEYRHTSVGSVFADGALAFEYVAAADGAQPRLACISTAESLW